METCEIHVLNSITKMYSVDFLSMYFAYSMKLVDIFLNVINSMFEIVSMHSHIIVTKKIPHCSVWGPGISPINHFIVKLHIEAEVSEGHWFSCCDVEGDKVLSVVLGHFGVLIFIFPPPVTLLIPVISTQVTIQVTKITHWKYLDFKSTYFKTVNIRSLMK